MKPRQFQQLRNLTHHHLNHLRWLIHRFDHRNRHRLM
jgi:hypothetical protein